jgi:hypothetical protein
MAEPFLVTLEGLEPALAQLAGIKNGVPRAVTRALNRTIESAATLTRRELARVTGLTQKRIKPTVVVERATFDQLVAAIRMRPADRPFSLVHFKRLVSVRRGKYGRYPVARGSVHVEISPHAFVAKMRSGRTGVFQRAGRARLPIEQQVGPQLTDVMREAGIETAVRAKIAATIGPTLQHEIAFLVRQRQARA